MPPRRIKLPTLGWKPDLNLPKLPSLEGLVSPETLDLLQPRAQEVSEEVQAFLDHMRTRAASRPTVAPGAATEMAFTPRTPITGRDPEWAASEGEIATQPRLKDYGPDKSLFTKQAQDEALLVGGGTVAPENLDKTTVREYEQFYGEGDTPEVPDAVPVVEMRRARAATPETTVEQPQWVERFPDFDSLREGIKRGEISTDIGRMVFSFLKTGIDPGIPRVEPLVQPAREAAPAHLVAKGPKESLWEEAERKRKFLQRKFQDGQVLTNSEYREKYGEKRPLWHQVPERIRKLQKNRDFPDLPGKLQGWWEDEYNAAYGYGGFQEVTANIANAAERRRAERTQPDLLASAQAQQPVIQATLGSWELKDLPPAPGSTKPGRKAEFVPNAAGLARPTALESLTGVKVPDLNQMVRQLEGETGEGTANQFAESRRKKPRSVALAIKKLVDAQIAPRQHLEVIWDRVAGQLGDEEGEHTFGKITQGVWDAYNGRVAQNVDEAGNVETVPIGYGKDILADEDYLKEARAYIAAHQEEIAALPPEEQRDALLELAAEFQGFWGDPLRHAELTPDERLRLAQQQLGQARQFYSGVGGAGFMEQIAKEDRGWNARQLSDWGKNQPINNWTGVLTDSEHRLELNPFARGLDSRQRHLIGQEPLQVLYKSRPQLTFNQVDNVRNGITDHLIVARKRDEAEPMAPGPQRVGDQDPLDVEVISVEPVDLHMGDVYLQNISERTGVPLRNLQLARDAGTEWDIVRVKPFGGAEWVEPPPVEQHRSWPPMHPKKPGQTVFHQGEGGLQQQARLEARPKVLQYILAQTHSRLITTRYGVGQEFFAVVMDPTTGELVGVGSDKAGNVKPYPLHRTASGQIAWTNARGQEIVITPHYIERGNYPLEAKESSSVIAPGERIPQGAPAEGTYEKDVIGIADLSTNRTIEATEDARRALRGQPLIVAGLPPAAEHSGGVSGLVSRPAGGFATTAYMDLRTESERFPRAELGERALASEHGGRAPQEVVGINLAPAPQRTHADIKSVVIKAHPETDFRHTSVSEMGEYPETRNTNKAQLTLIFTPRKPYQGNPDYHEPYRSDVEGVREMVNPTPEEIQRVLLHSVEPIQSIVYRVIPAQPDAKGRPKAQKAIDKHTRQRVLAVLQAIKRDPYQYQKDPRSTGIIGRQPAPTEWTVAGERTPSAPGYAMPSEALALQQSEYQNALLRLALWKQTAVQAQAEGRPVPPRPELPPKPPETDPRIGEAAAVAGRYGESSEAVKQIQTARARREEADLERDAEGKISEDELDRRNLMRLPRDLAAEAAMEETAEGVRTGAPTFRGTAAQQQAERGGMDMVTLYRVDFKDRRVQTGLPRKARRSRFVEDPEEFRALLALMGPDAGTIHAITIPRAEANRYNVAGLLAAGKQISAANPDNEFLLPRHLIDQSVPVNSFAVVDAPPLRARFPGDADVVPEILRKGTERPERTSGWLKSAAKFGGLGALGTVGLGLAENWAGENKAEAAPRTMHFDMDVAKAVRNATTEPGKYQRGSGEDALTKLWNFFTPVYKTAEKNGVSQEEQASLRHELQTKYGGVGANAISRYDPIRRVRESFDKRGLTEYFEFYLNKGQILRAWDVAAENRDDYLRDALIHDANGEHGLAKKKRALAAELNERIRTMKVAESGATKDDATNNLLELKAHVGADVYKEIEAAAQVVYKVGDEVLDDMHKAGLIPDESYKKYKKRGIDHIPAWKTNYEVKPDGTVVWHGGAPFQEVTTTIKGNTEALLEAQMGSTSIMKNPLSNMAEFVVKAQSEIARANMAKKVIDTFGKVGVAKLVDTRYKTRADPGQAFYTVLEGGESKTYMMPTQLVDALMYASEAATERFLAIPGSKPVGLLRTIAEAGATTWNLGWALGQGIFYDPAAALLQLPSRDHKIVRRAAPYFKTFARAVVDNYNSELRGKERSALHKQASRENALFAGASSDVMDIGDVEGRDMQKRASKAFQEGNYNEAAQLGIRKFMNKVGTKLVKPLEEANKMAAFQLLTDEGYTGAERAYHTRTRGGSPDWAQRGDADGWMRTFVTFGRPAILATETAIRSAKDDPEKYMRAFMGLAAIELARQGNNALVSSALGADHEEMEKRFSDYDRDNTWLVFMPPPIARMVTGERFETGANGIARPYAVKIPIPPIIQQWMSPLKGLMKAYSEGNPMEFPLEMFDELVPGSVPLKSGRLEETAQRRAIAALPAPLRWVAEQKMDKQAFTGAPIVGTRLEGLPEEEQYSESTDPIYREFGRILKRSPKRIEHTVKTFLPGLLQTPFQAANAMIPAERDESGQVIPEVEQSLPERISRTPVLGNVVGRFLPQRYEKDLGDLQDQFYEFANETKAGAAALNAYDQGIRGAPSELTAIKGDWNADVQDVVRELSDISIEQKQIQRDPSMTPRQKRDAMYKLMTEKRLLLREFLGDPEVQSLVAGRVPLPMQR